MASWSHEGGLEDGGILNEKEDEDSEREKKRSREVRVFLITEYVQTGHAT